MNDKPYEKDDDRIEVEKIPNGNKLSVRLAGKDDAGEYLCQVTAKETIELVHDVQIRGDKLHDILHIILKLVCVFANILKLFSPICSQALDSEHTRVGIGESRRRRACDPGLRGDARLPDP